MEITSELRALLELCAIRVDQESRDWNLIARQVLGPAGLDALRQGVITEKSAAAAKSRPVLRKGLQGSADLADRVGAELEAADRFGARLVRR